ncbi:MAG: Tol-Pal system beta propeller repeat protein TolB [Thiohalocapsa sp.]|jgi:TolB protein|uniref:Tol-Pal system beta propeller repeat protein TolB n=1 Tax=Thiohalocapsa sp. TaxID=2497641 RepID=UPI0025EA334D|nr:Tol-Pal system beta propeller repeat protein TolB [Thiohalocapsa sp.]MCG6942679.1 Tol-Pal system beta propeller repeat protein TolB [Thiohalocapsa sp.]
MQRPSITTTLLFAALLALVCSAGAQAKLTIEITGGVEGAQPIAVVPFGDVDGARPDVDIADVVAADLARSGKFKPMPRREMLMTPHREEDVDIREWQLLAMNSLVVGEVMPRAGGGYDIHYELLDVFSGKKLLADTVSSTSKGLRNAAHRIADAIYEDLTGEPGIFATRIAYVTSSGRNSRVVLRVADADGYNAQTIVDSAEPIMSPNWSPDARKLAYVSFEGRHSAIYVQDLASGRREQVASYEGINSAPAFSPDGRKLAMSLSKDGNPDIYVLDLTTRQLTRLTDHYAIDTEPAWSPDGSQLVFTSDRGGKPQIYRMSAAGGPAQRVTFEGDYNAAASYSPDGNALVMVTREGGRFRVVVTDTNGGSRRYVSSGPLDESPSFAPNGDMVIYATQNNGRGVLVATPLSSGASHRLSQDSGEVREPAWSPLLH